MENTHRKPKSSKNTKFKPKSNKKTLNARLNLVENPTFKLKSNGKRST